MEWIPIEERLPEQGSPILLTLADGQGGRAVEIGYVDASKAIHTLNGAQAPGVVAWMPLPGPYAG